MGILTVLGASVMLVSVTEKKVAERQRQVILAFNNAEAGIEQALYDLRQDFVNAAGSPSWSDSNINGYAIGPNTSSFYNIPYTSTSLNGGTYSVQLENVSGVNDEIWIKSTGTIGDQNQVIQVYVKMINLNPWNNAIFAGTGSNGKMVNGNVNILGSVHILGTGLSSTDYAVDLGGTAELVGDYYKNLSSSILAKIPALPTVNYNGETVSTLNAKLRVKHGKVGLSGSSSVGETDVAGNSVKETINGSYVTDGFGGTQGTNSVHSDNGWSNAYDLGDSVSFMSLSDPYPGYSSYQAYLKANALVISDAADLNTLAAITPNSNFNFSGPKGSIQMDGNGNLTVSGIVYIDGNGNLNMNKAGSNKTITYTGSASILVTGSAQISVNLVTNGNNSFPNNIIGLMTPNQVTCNEANIDVMGLIYAENTATVLKQTNFIGSIVSNYFDMGTNVPSIYQVPDVINNMPPGMIGKSSGWIMQVVSWQKL